MVHTTREIFLNLWPVKESCYWWPPLWLLKCFSLEVCQKFVCDIFLLFQEKGTFDLKFLKSSSLE